MGAHWPPEAIARAVTPNCGRLRAAFARLRKLDDRYGCGKQRRERDDEPENVETGDLECWAREGGIGESSLAHEVVLDLTLDYFHP